MQFDLNNKVVKLCADGMSAEAEGKIDLAKGLFAQAWAAAESNFEKFTAAHYMARNHEDATTELKWNEDALHFAMAIEEEDAKGQFPSLYLNIGKSHEKVGDIDAAKKNYQLAAEFSNYLPDGGYSEMIKSGVKAGLQRSGAVLEGSYVLDAMIDKWCEQKMLKPLAFVLPAYIGYLGTINDRNKLISALSYLSATRCLDAEDQQRTDELIAALAIADNNTD